MKQLNARQLARELNIRGWTCVRSNGGSHSQYRNPSSPKVITLAGHGARPIPPGLLRKILRDAGIDPKARAILERHRDGGDVPFSPVRAFGEYLDARRAARVTPIYGRRKDAPPVPRVLGERWTTEAYAKTIRAACCKAKITPWSANRLRHTFGTEVRRAFGLDAARAVLGHTGGGCITDVYTFDALADEMVRKAAPAVEAMG